MANIKLSDALRREYQILFDTCQVSSSSASEVERIVRALIGNKARYVSVGAPLGVPWYVVAVIHNMEGSQRFDTHLHNGDPLTARTKQVPAGRPTTGVPPFTGMI